MQAFAIMHHMLSKLSVGACGLFPFTALNWSDNWSLWNWSMEVPFVFQLISSSYLCVCFTNITALLRKKKKSLFFYLNMQKKKTKENNS